MVGIPMLLSGKKALITGATSGIGRATALLFASNGAEVVVAGRDERRGVEVVGRIRAAGGAAAFLPVELTNVSSIRELVEAAIRTLGTIDILVNNAGVTRRIPLFQVSEEDWDAIADVNAKAVFFCLQAVAGHMREQHSGKIVNVSSIGGKGLRGTSNAAYAAAKAAVVAMTRVAAADLGAFNINVNAVCPGPTRTAMVGRDNPEVTRALCGAAVLARMNEPSDVAAACLFLASKLADNMTGQSINVDNGTVWD